MDSARIALIFLVRQLRDESQASSAARRSSCTRSETVARSLARDPLRIATSGASEVRSAAMSGVVVVVAVFGAGGIDWVTAEEFAPGPKVLPAERDSAVVDAMIGIVSRLSLDNDLIRR